ncbi:MAG TPA: hypothetical protein VEV83_20125, partial [Parafilimonas sp.]|nr:hypothetical protein [Parafilimonas sp.]
MKTKLFFLITSLAVYAANGFPQVSIDWLHSINTHPERGASIARDNSNNTYALGSGGGFIYLTKRDKFGNFKWQVKSTSYLGENAVRVFVDPQGNAVAVGYRYSTLHEGPFAVALIVLKYTPAGDLIYKTVIPGTYTYFNNSENRTNITAEMDGAGNIYIGTEGQVTGYPKQGFNAVKVSSAGSVVWVSTETFNIGSNFFYVSNIRLRGNRLGLEGTTLYFTANASTWVLDTTGHSLWSNVSPGILGQDIAFDKNANTYVLTSFNNNFKYDVGLYKFGKTGGIPVTKSYDFGSNELGYGMEMMPNQSLAIMGASTQQNGGLAYLDWVTFRVDLSGNLIWSKRYDKSTGNDEIPRMIKVDASNNIYVTGIGGPFPGGSNLGALQGVTLKYSANGALKWKSIIDTLGFDGVNLALGTDTSVFVISASASA